MEHDMVQPGAVVASVCGRSYTNPFDGSKAGTLYERVESDEA